MLSESILFLIAFNVFFKKKIEYNSSPKKKNGTYRALVIVSQIISYNTMHITSVPNNENENEYKTEESEVKPHTHTPPTIPKRNA